MLYIRKLFNQDLRDGKQIAFPKEPSYSFFAFDYLAKEADRRISFIFKAEFGQFQDFDGRVITTRLYAAGSESRMDGEVKAFIRDELNAEVDDLLIFKNKGTKHTEFEFMFVPKSNTQYYPLLLNLSSGDNHSVFSFDEQHQQEIPLEYPLQQIFYGAPGTGKSHTINEITEKQPKDNVFRTTFHPDSDYATFVGCYKPTKEATGLLSLHKLHELYPEFKTKVGNRPLHRFITKYHNSFRLLTEKEAESVFDKIETSLTVTAEVPKIMSAIEEIPSSSSISYSFSPQNFTKAYIRAWQTEEPVFLIIEEINRGNCAQIFGDLFQLLDRKNGLSEYPIKADNDLAAYIGEQLSKESREGIPDTVKSGEELILPSNLYIWATMNTSDQSLFPIDSAFKRRWEWKYLPINNHEDKNYKIEVGNNKYDWWGFLSKINEVIGNTTSSEDKKLGYFFAKANENGVVTAEQFVGKVLFYLWNDVFKNYGFDNQIFDKGDKKKFEFSDFFKQDGKPDTDMVIRFLKKLDETVDKENTFDEKLKGNKGQEELSDTEA